MSKNKKLKKEDELEVKVEVTEEVVETPEAVTPEFEEILKDVLIEEVDKAVEEAVVEEEEEKEDVVVEEPQYKKVQELNAQEYRMYRNTGKLPLK